MEIETIIAEYKAGKTLQQIATDNGVSKQYIDQLLTKHNVPRRSKKKVTEEVKLAIKFYGEEGRNYGEIAYITGVSRSTVCVVLKEMGISCKGKPYKCRKCGGTEWRKNGANGKICKACSAKRARENYQKRKAK